jgi:hypothetical protein
VSRPILSRRPRVTTFCSSVPSLRGTVTVISSHSSCLYSSCGLQGGAAAHIVVWQYTDT